MCDVVDGQSFSPQHHRAADARFRHFAQINSQHVHRWPSRHPCFFSAHENRRSVGREPGITIRVPAGDDADPMRMRCSVRRAVTDAVIRLQLAHVDEARAERHHGLQANRLRGLRRKRRRTVEHDAGPHDVAANLRISDHTCRIGDRARIRQSLARRFECIERFLEAVVVFGAREMRHQTQRRDARAPRQSLADARDVADGKTKPVHAGVDLDEDLQRTCERRSLEHRHLVRMMDDDREPALRNFRKLALLKKTFQ